MNVTKKTKWIPYSRLWSLILFLVTLHFKKASICLKFCEFFHEFSVHPCWLDILKDKYRLKTEPFGEPFLIWFQLCMHLAFTADMQALQICKSVFPLHVQDTIIEDIWWRLPTYIKGYIEDILCRLPTYIKGYIEDIRCRLPTYIKGYIEDIRCRLPTYKKGCI